MLRRRVLCLAVPFCCRCACHARHDDSRAALPAVGRPRTRWPLVHRPGRHTALCNARRTLKTLDVREYLPLGTPIEFRFYQRYANHPNRQSGVQFLTHYNTHQRFRVRKDFIDYMNWGKEQGQARLPHRHQRVAFDFDDVLHPTRVAEVNMGWFASQDPTMDPPAALSTSFDPNRRVFSHPEHWNKMFSKRRPGEGDIKLDVVDSHSLLGPLLTQTDTQDTHYFRGETRGPTHGAVPGVNRPFLGEPDNKMMQAMSRPLNASQTLTGNDGRFSKIIYLNDPARHQCLSTSLAKELNLQLDRATNAVHSKLVVLEAAQSGLTEYFCGGLDVSAMELDMQLAAGRRARAAQLAADMESTSSNSEGEAVVNMAKERETLLQEAVRYEDRADAMLREHAALIWRAYTAPRPLMALVNGKCRNTGCGLALATRYCALKDATEFVVDGPHMGLTPFGGSTRWLARPETALKYPGLAAFVLLTSNSLFAGDALRLGWTDLFTSLPDMGYHIKEWFNASEHMHNDAVAWQLGHLLQSCFRMTSAHSGAMERCAVTPLRARWIADAFADQPSVEAIVSTLGAIEALALDDAHNTQDAVQATPFTVASVAAGVRRLTEAQLRYSLAPWDIMPTQEASSSAAGPDETALQVRQAGEIFTAYVLERHGNMDLAIHRDRARLRRWKEQREEEYRRYREMRAAPHARHVYARLEGCEGTVVEFDHVFDLRAAQEEVHAADADATRRDRVMVRELKAAVLRALKMPAGREVEIGWYLPTLDTCVVHTDEELIAVLQNDPGLEDLSAPQPPRYPPVYFLVKRNTLYFSEWAYAVKHQLLLQCPYALKATYAMLQEVQACGTSGQQTERKDDEEEKESDAMRALIAGQASETTTRPAASLNDTLAIEYKYIARAMQRPDFYAVGQYTDKDAAWWQEAREARAHNVHQTHLPLRPLPDYEDVFERNVTLDGHTFQLRPRWSPRTLREVGEAELARLHAPLDFARDQRVPLDAATHASKAERLPGMIEDAGGLEVVPGLGERSAASGQPLVAPLHGDAHVPTNVNFYEMARHPFLETASSWRQAGYTEGSMAYFEARHAEAERAVYDEEGRGVRHYWPSKAAAEATTTAGEKETQALLQERLFGELHRAGRQVEPWARQLRANAVQSSLRYPTEIATPQEKIYDDEYYRWFIQPGHHPNPSGMLRGGSGHGEGRAGTPKSSEARELETFLHSLLAGGGQHGASGGGVEEDFAAGHEEEVAGATGSEESSAAAIDPIVEE